MQVVNDMLLPSTLLQELSVEVWHHCPRSEAAAAALAAGKSCTAVDGASGNSREVLLGRASCSLAGVLARQGGVRCWLPLRSAATDSCAIVGAVQVAVRLAELGGQPVDEEDSPLDGSWSLLGRCPEAAALLPPPQRQRLLLPLSDPLAAGFFGQAALVSLSISEVALPQRSGGSAHSSRPKAAKYFACASLPSSSAGRGCSITTAARTVTAVGGGMPGQQDQWAARLGHVSTLQVPMRDCCAHVLMLAQQVLWLPRPTHMSHCVVSSLLHLPPVPCMQVTAGTVLHQTLVRQPLTIQVYRQPTSGVGSPSRAVNNSAIHVGAAELELWPLVLPGPAAGANGAAAEQRRRLGRQCVLVDPAAASMGAAAVSVEVSLVLEPSPDELAGASERWECGDGQVDEPQRPEEEEELQFSLAPPPSARQQVAGAAGECEPSAGQAGQEEPPGGSQPGQETAGASQEGGGMPGGASGRPLGQEGSAGLSPAQLQLGQQDAAGELPASGKLLVQIDTALHLPTSGTAGGAGHATWDASSYSCWVQAVWGQQRQHQLRTPAVPVHVVDAAEMGGTAVWNATLELPAAADVFDSSIGGSGHKGGAGDAGRRGPVLLLNLWSTRSSSGRASRGGASSSQHGGDSRPSSSAGADDTLIGCAALELAALPLMGETAGWWNVGEITS